MLEGLFLLTVIRLFSSGNFSIVLKLKKRRIEAGFYNFFIAYGFNLLSVVIFKTLVNQYISYVPINC